MAANLLALECNIQAPLFDLGVLSTGSNKVGLQGFIQGCEEGSPLGVLVRVSERSGVLFKVISLLYLSIRIRVLYRQLEGQGIDIKGFYSVYPSIEQPVAIYSIGGEAEKYTHKYVLPAFPSGASGTLRTLIMKLTKLHPSVAGVVILGWKKQ